MWETYEDISYYGMWAVKRRNDRNFNNGHLFHLMTRSEAQRLAELLNTLEEDFSYEL